MLSSRNLNGVLTRLLAKYVHNFSRSKYLRNVFVLEFNAVVSYRFCFRFLRSVVWRLCLLSLRDVGCGARVSRPRLLPGRLLRRRRTPLPNRHRLLRPRRLELWRHHA